MIRALLKGILLVFVLSTTLVEAQNLSAAARRTPVFTDLMNGLPIARPASGVVGDPYLSGWRLTSLKLYDYPDNVEGYYMRYNIYFDELDFKTQSGVRAIEGTKVNSFVLKDSLSLRFVNAKDYKLDDVPLTGFFQVLVDGAAPLFRKYYVEVKNPDYHPALNTGSRDTRLNKRFDIYYGQNGQVFKFKNKKKLMPFFGDKTAQVEQFIKDNRLSGSDERSLLAIFKYYNSLLE